MLNSIEVKCKDPTCRFVFAYENRKHHIHGVKIEECPFGCDNFEPCEPHLLKKHVKNDCTGKMLRCPETDCDINLYREYEGQTPLH